MRISPIEEMNEEALQIIWNNSCFDNNYADDFDEIREQIVAEWLGLDECDDVDYSEVLKYAPDYDINMW